MNSSADGPLLAIGYAMVTFRQIIRLSLFCLLAQANFAFAGVTIAKSKHSRGDTIHFYFENGSTMLRKYVEIVSRAWLYEPEAVPLNFVFHSPHESYFDRRYAIRIRFHKRCSTFDGKANLPTPGLLPNEWFSNGQLINLCIQDREMDNSEFAFTLSPKTILHEIGHALGLQHEHQHPLAPAAESFTIKDCEDWPGMDCKELLPFHDSGGGHIFYEYDNRSVMHYNRTPSPGPISSGDFQAIAGLYGGQARFLSDEELRKHNFLLFRELSRAKLLKGWFKSCEYDRALSMQYRSDDGSFFSRVAIFDPNRRIVPKSLEQIGPDKNINDGRYAIDMPMAADWQSQLRAGVASILRYCNADSKYLEVLNFAEINFSGTTGKHINLDARFEPDVIDHPDFGKSPR